MTNFTQEQIDAVAQAFREIMQSIRDTLQRCFDSVCRFMQLPSVQAWIARTKASTPKPKPMKKALYRLTVDGETHYFRSRKRLLAFQNRTGLA